MDDLKKEMTEHEKRTYDSVMEGIQREWEENKEFHARRRATTRGIKSSQISAAVAYLIKRGTISLD